jgi:hypothetical protein
MFLLMQAYLLYCTPPMCSERTCNNVTTGAATGLYGNAAPATVANFLAVVQQGGLSGSSFSRISPGEYIQAGRQGSRRLGELEGLQGLKVRA